MWLVILIPTKCHATLGHDIDAATVPFALQIDISLIVPVVKFMPTPILKSQITENENISNENTTIIEESNNNIITNLEAGIYQLTVTDSNGCEVAEGGTVEINNPPPITYSISAGNYAGGFGVSCYGATDGNIETSVNGGCPPYIYEWSNGETTDNISNIGAGTYSVTVTDQNECSICRS